jgi:hypothetical protein
MSGRRAAKVDSNHADIVKALRKVGAFVQSLATVGDGCLDLLVAYQGHWHVIEIKDGTKPPSQRRLTPDQVRWISVLDTRAPVYVVKSVDEAIACLNAVD